MAKDADKSTPAVVWKIPHGSGNSPTPPERSLAEEWQRRGQELRRTFIAWRGLLLGLATPLNLPQPPAGEPASSPDRHGRAGAKRKYDWDAIQAHCHVSFDVNGYPENVSEFCRDDVIPWCVNQFGENKTPDMETLRPYVTKWIAAWRRSLPSK